MNTKEIIKRLKECKTPSHLGNQWYDNDMVNDLIKDLENSDTSMSYKTALKVVQTESDEMTAERIMELYETIKKLCTGDRG
jgi:ribosome recycling factor